ncbi:MAG TPA: hypothetical protein PLD25_30745, partial [Chloroflexota bacterium]|nr:hypothetical protein [Chloroflexota bacterium]
FLSSNALQMGQQERGNLNRGQGWGEGGSQPQGVSQTFQKRHNEGVGMVYEKGMMFRTPSCIEWNICSAPGQDCNHTLR